MSDKFPAQKKVLMSEMDYSRMVKNKASNLK